MIYRVSGKVVLSSAAHFFWNFFNETNLRVLTISHPQVQSVTEMVVEELVGLITNICATNGDQTKSPVYCLSIVYTHVCLFDNQGNVSPVEPHYTISTIYSHKQGSASFLLMFHWEFGVAFY